MSGFRCNCMLHWKYSTCTFPLHFHWLSGMPVLNCAFCSANSKSGYLEMNKGTEPFKIISGEGNPLSILLPLHLTPSHFFVQFFSKKTSVFLPTKETFHKVRQQGGRLATTANGIQYLDLRLIKWLIFIWYFPPWEIQKQFFFPA